MKRMLIIISCMFLLTSCSKAVHASETIAETTTAPTEASRGTQITALKLPVEFKYNGTTVTVEQVRTYQMKVEQYYLLFDIYIFDVAELTDDQIDDFMNKDLRKSFIMAEGSLNGLSNEKLEYLGAQKVETHPKVKMAWCEGFDVKSVNPFNGIELRTVLWIDNNDDTYTTIYHGDVPEIVDMETSTNEYDMYFLTDLINKRG